MKNKFYILAFCITLLIAPMTLATETWAYDYLPSDEGIHFGDNYSITNIYNNYTYNGSTLELDDISDVSASSPSDGESLVWSSALTKWISETVISRWIVSTANGFLYNDADTLYFNDTKLNDTIDARSGNVTTGTDFNIFINGSSYNNINHNITAGDADDVEFTIIPGNKFIFGDTFT